MQDMSSMILNEIEEAVINLGEPRFRARQIYEWIRERGAVSFEEMNNIPKSLRKTLSEQYWLARADILKKFVSKDDSVKYLLKTRDGLKIEAVSLPYQNEVSFCISTQAGCKMGCVFCESGRRFERNLSAGEMFKQMEALKNDSEKKLRGIVLMGMGEPFDNYDETLRFITLADAGKRRITVSTCGIVPGIYDFANANLQCNLAISLHAPNDALRKTLMPIAAKYDLESLMEAARYYINLTKRRLTYEYIVFPGQNDGQKNAEALANLIKNQNALVNLIPLNKGAQTDRRPANVFAALLQKAGVSVAVRRTIALDVGGACGQLSLN